MIPTLLLNETSTLILQNTGNALEIDGNVIAYQHITIGGDMTLSTIPTTNLNVTDLPHLHFLTLENSSNLVKSIPMINIGGITQYTSPTIQPTSNIPIGAILPFPFDVLGSVEYILCDGRQLDRVLYQSLFNVIGTMYGTGNNTTTFNVPNYSGMFFRGADEGALIDPESNSRTNITASAIGSIQSYKTATPSIPFSLSVDGEHQHYNPSHLGNDLPGIGATQKVGNYDNENMTDFQGIHSHSIIGGDNETRPANIYVKYYIKSA